MPQEPKDILEVALSISEQVVVQIVPLVSADNMLGSEAHLGGRLEVQLEADSVCGAHNGVNQSANSGAALEMGIEHGLLLLWARRNCFILARRILVERGILVGSFALTKKKYCAWHVFSHPFSSSCETRLSIRLDWYLFCWTFFRLLVADVFVCPVSWQRRGVVVNRQVWSGGGGPKAPREGGFI